MRSKKLRIIKNNAFTDLPSKNNSSFPSKHTVVVFALATSVLLRERVFG